VLTSGSANYPGFLGSSPRRANPVSPNQERGVGFAVGSLSVTYPRIVDRLGCAGKPEHAEE
jgi:hypothetical protein